MPVEVVKVTKNGITKEILAKDLAQYLSMGWQKVEKQDFNTYTAPKRFERV